MSYRTRRPLLLHVGDDTPLRFTRSAIFSSAFDVMECTSADAWENFLAMPSIEAVVICGSLTQAAQNLLTIRIRSHSLYLPVFQIGDAEWGTPSTTIFKLNPRAPESLVPHISSVLAKRATREDSPVPPSPPAER